MNRDGKDIQDGGSTGEDWSMCKLPMPWLVRLGAQGLPPSCACGESCQEVLMCPDTTSETQAAENTEQEDEKPAVSRAYALV